MVCKHLHEIETAIAKSGLTETHRGQVWTKSCREWIYYDCYLDIPAIRAVFNLAPEVTDHANHDPRSGREAGLTCEICKDAIMGCHPEDAEGKPVFPDPSK